MNNSSPQLSVKNDAERASCCSDSGCCGGQSSDSLQPNLPKIGRNDPCFCGSGKKYKKCCGK